MPPPDASGTDVSGPTPVTLIPDSGPYPRNEGGATFCLPRFDIRRGLSGGQAFPTSSPMTPNVSPGFNVKPESSPRFWRPSTTPCDLLVIAYVRSGRAQSHS